MAMLKVMITFITRTNCMYFFNNLSQIEIKPNENETKSLVRLNKLLQNSKILLCKLNFFTLISKSFLVIKTTVTNHRHET